MNRYIIRRRIYSNHSTFLIPRHRRVDCYRQRRIIIIIIITERKRIYNV